jgi:phosphoserine aminotransferase
VVTFSWQKSLGGEGAHGMLILSPNAVARMEAYSPHWPLPKIFRLTKNGKLIEGTFEGETLNTPSMLCVEDYLDTLKWSESIGGISALIARVEENFAALARWVNEAPWVEFLAREEKSRSHTSVCLKITDPWFTKMPEEARSETVKKIASLLEKEHAAYDMTGHRYAPAGLRIWCGPTIERPDIEALTPWLDWAWAQVKGAA